MTPAGFRVATPDDVDEVARMLSAAFRDDPVWGPAFPDPVRRVEQSTAFWRLIAGEAQREPWTLLSPGDDAVAIWYPPGMTELGPEAEAGFDGFITDLIGAEGAAALARQGAPFAAARPSEPHFYLSLLATDPERRGRGSGMRLLDDSLRAIDELGLPTYLESSNPANDARYERHGYTRVGELALDTGARVGTFWRPLGG